jgi:3-hydroxymyristoyl/3-hydroxydecanoyl-(acyl carrier protein) dehydratase
MKITNPQQDLAMQKRQGPNTDTNVPRPPQASHPLLAHHERLASAHTDFLRLQEQMHQEFIAHRQRLLELMPRPGGALPAEPAAALEPIVLPPPRPRAPVQVSVPEPPRFALTTLTTSVTWEDPLLDSHVMPLGVFLAPLGSTITGAAAPGVLEVELEAFGALPGPGERVVTELRTAPPGSGTAGRTDFELNCRVREGGRQLVQVRGHHDGRASLESSTRATDSGRPAAAPVGPCWTEKREFSERDVAAFLGGDTLGCFGRGFERAGAHTRTPPLPGATLVRLATVSVDPTGGPRSLGSLKAKSAPDDAESPAARDAGLRIGRVYQGAQQLLAFFMAAAGCTISRDGSRFEAPGGYTSRLRFADAPALDVPLDYQLTIESFDPAARTAVGDVKAWAGDKLVFHGERIALRLVQDFPLSSDRGLQADAAADDAAGRPAADIDGFKLGYSSMAAGALGWPKAAFNQAGDFFEKSDRQMPRLPGPPYHFVTRVTAVSGERLSMKPGAEATMEYDVPPDAWYFDENGNRTMPWCVLLEAALQPCGWLSVYVGCPLAASEDVFFRNLDGAGAMLGEVFPDSGTVRTTTKVTSVANVAGIMLISYRIECFVGDRKVCKLTASFGYFPNEALAQQVGLPMPPEQKRRLSAASNVQVELRERPEKYYTGALRLPGPMLLMIDRVTGFWPDEGTAGKGRLRAEKTVNPRDWFFQSHFFRDPVQPGSLGIEMMLQLMQYHVIEHELAKGLEQPYFEPLALESHVSWKFRGQVRPESKHIVADLEIVSVESLPDCVTVLVNGSLWVDGVRCYEAKGLGMRVRSGRAVAVLPRRVKETLLDPAVDRWVSDHRPSYTVPVMPGMSMVDRLAGAALEHVRGAYPGAASTPDWGITGIADFRAHGWLVCDRPRKLRTEVDLAAARAVHRTHEVEVTAAMFDLTDADGAPRKVASGRVRVARKWPMPPPAWPSLADATVAPSPYEAGSIFWGPRLQLLRRLAIGPRGASAELDAAGADAPIGALHHILLDGALHAIPHDELDRWSDKIAPGYMGVPVRLTARFFGPAPREGKIRAEIRFAGFDGANALPAFNIQLIDPQERVWAVLRHVEMLVPTSHQWKKEHRVPFLVERRFVEGAGLSRNHADRTELSAAEVKRMDSLPGSVAQAYGLERDAAVDNRLVAIKDHVGQLAKVHPAHVVVDPTLSEAYSEEHPDVRYRVSVEMRGDDVVVRDANRIS